MSCQLGLALHAKLVFVHLLVFVCVLLSFLVYICLPVLLIAIFLHCHIMPVSFVMAVRSFALQHVICIELHYNYLLQCIAVHHVICIELRSITIIKVYKISSLQ